MDVNNNKQWTMHRAGLINFWYYDDEEFSFSNGKLLLRGSNGSGKSVTMQSLLPVLLDGRKSPDRLDPFGSRSRKMEDYLLGEKEVVNRDERTGYLFLEYKRANSNQYFTTGIGLKAKRHGTMDFWGFVIHDNRRIGREIKLYQLERGNDGKKEKVPLSRVQLENLLEQGGRVVRTQKEYMGLVNKHLFGFENVQDFKELIELLLQLRSPKLSKDFKPTVIYEILNRSLPGISDEELRPLAETIEQMDRTKQQLEQLEKEQKAMSQLAKVYQAYEEQVLLEKAEQFVKVDKSWRKQSKQVETLQSQVEEKQQQLEITTREHQDEANRLDVLKEEQQQLKSHEVFQLQEQREQVGKLIEAERAELAKKETALERKQKRERELNEQLNALDNNKNSNEMKLEQSLEELVFFQETAYVPFHEAHMNDFERLAMPERLDLVAVWDHKVKQFDEQVKEIAKQWGHYSREHERYEAALLDYDDAKKNLDEARFQQSKWEAVFEEEKETLLQRLFTWLEQQQWLEITDDIFQQIATMMPALFERWSYEELLQRVNEMSARYVTKKQEHKVKTNFQLTEKNRELETNQKEIRHWETLKDPEPERERSTEQEREKLQQQGVVFVPFYAAVEFRNDVSTSIRNQLEGALRDSGLLDALIVEKGTNERFLHNRVIKPNPLKGTATLFDYLEPNVHESIAHLKETVQHVLQTIQVSDVRAVEGMTVIAPDGSYQLGIVHGHPASEWMKEARYIGKSAREAYRKREIERLQTERNTLFAERKQIEAELVMIEKELSAHKQWTEQMPTINNAKAAYDEVQQALRDVQAKEKEATRKNEQMKSVLAHVQTLKNELQEKMAPFAIPKNQEAYEEASDTIKDYYKELIHVKSYVQQLISIETQLQQTAEALALLVEEVDEIRGEIGSVESKLKKLHYQVERLNKQLMEIGEADLLAQIERLQEECGLLEAKVNELYERKIRLDASIPGDQKRLDEEKERLYYSTELRNFCEAILKEEVALQGKENVQTDESLVDWAKTIVASYTSRIERGPIEQRLVNVFYQSQETLREYRMLQQPILEAHLPALLEDDRVPEAIAVLANEARTGASRQQLLLEYQGRKQEPAMILQKLEEEIIQQQSYLDDQDRELFHEIIVNNIGSQIRGKIYRAEQWVKKTAKHMEERDNSSGLTFSLKWNPIPAEYEDQLDTAELVHLLKKNAQLLTDGELEKMRHHFRSKINHAKAQQQEQGFGESFHQLLRDTLDYRKWFVFTLYFKRENEPRRELTNNQFFKFSGGEKAMAMYIPLFSAVHSRYQEARADAPPIICLDEAFAGVDERNIQDMFKLVEELGFNYIMNSQALWGDYETVSSIAIAELVRPKNANFVTVIRYLWDGKVRHLQVPNELQEKEEELSLF